MSFARLRFQLLSERGLIVWAGQHRGCLTLGHLPLPPQVLNTQRDKVYGQRRRALLSRDLSPQMTEFAERTVDDVLEVCRPSLLF